RFLDIDPSSWLESHTKGRTTPLGADHPRSAPTRGSSQTFVETPVRVPESGYHRSRRNDLLFVGVPSFIEERDRSSIAWLACALHEARRRTTAAGRISFVDVRADQEFVYYTWIADRT
ncbi:hypothetical protein, partial [Methylorubrum extorquens]